MAHDMSADERREFLLEGTRTGKVATTRADGRPHVTPVWFTLDGDEILFTTDDTSLKAKTMGADRAGEFGGRNAVPGELVVRITPTHIVARADIAD
jgi:nitroimidazol reductase NimA-like FMN-containing flavoprotein (pyridoxamine 5'-phosphate oxidase superfamily)